MRPLFIAFMALMLFMITQAEAAERIKASDWEETKYNVAQVVAQLPIQGLPTSAQLTTVYRGGIAAPFGVFLSIWDPVPSEGGDFGSVKTFDLGNYSDIPKVLGRTLRKPKENRSVLVLTLRTSLPDENLTGTRPVRLKLSVGIGPESVDDSITLER